MKIWKDIQNPKTLNLFAGPCLAESHDVCQTTALKLKKICQKQGVNYIFKASFDKANRSSWHSERGHGMEKGLEMLSMLSKVVPIVTDVHEPWQCKPVSEIVDVIQIPALLSRQTDLLKAAAETGKIVNVKKGQFMAPMDILNVVEKLEYFGCEKIILTERGTTFGYNNLVVDMRSLKQMKKLSYPVMFDVTHSVQTPGSKGSSSGGDVEYVEPLAMAAIAAGAGSLFVETHPDPSEAWCDGPNSVPLEDMDKLIEKAKSVFDLNLS